MRRRPPVDVAYGASAVVSVATCGGLLLAAARRRGGSRWVAAGLLSLIALAVGVQRYTFDRFHTHLDGAALRAGAAMAEGVIEELAGSPGDLTRTLGAPLLAVALVAVCIRRTAPTRPRVGSAGVLMGAAGLVWMALPVGRAAVTPRRALTPDAELIAGIGELTVFGMGPGAAAGARPLHRPGARTPHPVSRFTPAAPPTRNVLVLLTESVRRDAWCALGDGDCRTTPRSQRATPHRIELGNVRSVDSTTAISMAVLLTGLPVDRPRAELHSAPLLYEYARAAGIRTGHFSAQNHDFGGAGAFLEGAPLDRLVHARLIDPDAPFVLGVEDEVLVEHVLPQLTLLGEPFVATVQLASTHFPYRIDPRDQPFLPQSIENGPEHAAGRRNRYLNAVHLQDRAVARLISAIRDEAYGQRTVIVFLSDHGEALYERGFGFHATSLYEEEIAIPFWIDAPPGVLSAVEGDQLRALRTAPRTTLDALPTVLDLLGILDEPPLAPFRRAMSGQSLLRGGSPDDTIVTLTNCSELWTCVIPALGILRGDRKYIWRDGEDDFRCFDVAHDPAERLDLGAAACSDLAGLAGAHRQRQLALLAPH